MSLRVKRSNLAVTEEIAAHLSALAMTCISSVWDAYRRIWDIRFFLTLNNSQILQKPNAEKILI